MIICSVAVFDLSKVILYIFVKKCIIMLYSIIHIQEHQSYGRVQGPLSVQRDRVASVGYQGRLDTGPVQEIAVLSLYQEPGILSPCQDGTPGGGGQGVCCQEEGNHGGGGEEEEGR